MSLPHCCNNFNKILKMPSQAQNLYTWFSEYYKLIVNVYRYPERKQEWIWKYLKLKHDFIILSFKSYLDMVTFHREGQLKKCGRREVLFSFINQIIRLTVFSFTIFCIQAAPCYLKGFPSLLEPDVGIHGLRACSHWFVVFRLGLDSLLSSAEATWICPQTSEQPPPLQFWVLAKAEVMFICI